MERPIAHCGRRLIAAVALALGATAGTLAWSDESHMHQHAGPRNIRYDVIDLGFFQAREAEERPGLNAASHVAAWSVVDQARVVATVIVARHSSQIPNPSPLMNAYAFGINDSDQAVGQIESGADVRQTHAFFYDGSTLHLLPSLGGPYSTARAIGHHATIVGNAQTNEFAVHAAVWRSLKKARDLGTLRGGDFSRAYAINGHDDIVGESNETLNGKAQAVKWSRGRIRKLGLLPGGTQSVAISANDNGLAVGYADDAAGNAKAVLFKNGNVEVLGTLGDDPSLALDINEAGQVVGNSSIHMGLMKMRGFLWEQGQMAELDNLVPDDGWVLMGAFRINRQGEILAYGFYQGHTHLCLLMPLKKTP
jgi:probable HAF family extracellular repeat protein